MTHSVSEGDRKFLSQVESCKFPLAEFNHRAHLRLAFIYLAAHDVDTTFSLTRDTILGLLEHNNIDKAKFHVTLTRAWILAVRHFMESITESTSADEFINKMPVMLDSKIMLSHYSGETLFSEKARAEFVQPDLQPIPDSSSWKEDRLTWICMES